MGIKKQQHGNECSVDICVLMMIRKFLSQASSLFLCKDRDLILQMKRISVYVTAG